jgi:hypothetical protein
MSPCVPRTRRPWSGRVFRRPTDSRWPPGIVLNSSGLPRIKTGTSRSAGWNRVFSCSSLLGSVRRGCPWSSASSLRQPPRELWPSGWRHTLPLVAGQCVKALRGDPTQNRSPLPLDLAVQDRQIVADALDPRVRISAPQHRREFRTAPAHRVGAAGRRPRSYGRQDQADATAAVIVSHDHGSPSSSYLMVG